MAAAGYGRMTSVHLLKRLNVGLWGGRHHVPGRDSNSSRMAFGWCVHGYSGHLALTAWLAMWYYMRSLVGRLGDV